MFAFVLLGRVSAKVNCNVSFTTLAFDGVIVVNHSN